MQRRLDIRAERKKLRTLRADPVIRYGRFQYAGPQYVELRSRLRDAHARFQSAEEVVIQVLAVLQRAVRIADGNGGRRSGINI